MTCPLALVILFGVLACAGPRGVVAVALSGVDSVALYDAQSLALIATLPAGRNPHEIAASSDGRRAYVANAGDTSITVLEGAPAPRVVSTWYLPDSIRVHDVAASRDGRTVWGAAAERQLVLDIDAASGRVRRRLRVDRPGGWMIETGGPDGRIVVANLEGGAVTLLDPANGGQQVFLAKEGEIDASPTPDGREIWSANLHTDSLTVFDARTGTVLERMLSGKGTGRVIFTRDGQKGLAVNGGDSTVVAFDVGSRRRLAVIAVAGDPKVIAIDRAGRRAYLTHPERDLLTVVDVGSMTVIRSVAVPGTPDGIAVLEP